MRWGLSVITATLALAAALPARAGGEGDDVALLAKGEALAKAGRFSDAIDAFKAADRIHPRTAHACLIALAYARRELWPQAEVFLDTCHERATPSDPLPAWVPKQDTEIAKRLAAANAAPVTLAVEPADPRATLTLSSFLPDEAFAPRTVHLPPGQYVVVAHVPGRPDAQKTFDVTDRHAQRVEIATARPAEPPAGLPTPPAVPPTPPSVPIAAITPPRQAVAPPPAGVLVPPAHPRSHRLSYAVGGAGVALVVAGVIYQQTVLQTATDMLSDGNTADYDRWEHRFDVRRTSTYALYGAGVTALAAGIVLRVTVERGPVLAIEPQPGGGVVSLAWSR